VWHARRSNPAQFPTVRKVGQGQTSGVAVGRDQGDASQYLEESLPHVPKPFGIAK
jgi:hypothetical protein